VLLQRRQRLGGEHLDVESSAFLRPRRIPSRPSRDPSPSCSGTPGQTGRAAIAQIIAFLLALLGRFIERF
jgi:hypothetical protein